MEKLKCLKEKLTDCVEMQLANLEHADAKELGEVVDMIKDLEEAMYYCSMTKVLEHKNEEEDYRKQAALMGTYERPALGMGDSYYRDMDRNQGRMYYQEGAGNYMGGQYMGRDSGGRYMPHDEGHRSREVPFGDMRDSREGRSAMSRRYYMEAKETHQGQDRKVKELERYMRELSDDIVDMIQDASPEEKEMLERKMQQLTSKLSQI